jgi:hypothetical protein
MLRPVLSSEELWFEASGQRRDFFTLRQLLRARAVYFISGSATTSTIANLALLFRKPVVMHWVGTDILKTLDAHAQGRLSQRFSQACIHWTGVPWIAEELASIGIQAQVVPLTSAAFPARFPPLPLEFRILTYFGVRTQFYGFEHLRRWLGLGYKTASQPSTIRITFLCGKRFAEPSPKARGGLTLDQAATWKGFAISS